MNIVLFQPEIPQNTGNIMRTCSATGATLHIIGPLKFELNDESLKRAGMDYVTTLEYHYYDSFEDFRSITVKDLECVSEIIECYIYIGEECTPALAVAEILAITFWPADVDPVDIHRNVIIKYNENRKDETKYNNFNWLYTMIFLAVIILGAVIIIMVRGIVTDLKK